MILENYKQKIRITTYTASKIILSNGHIIESRNEVIGLNRRIKKERLKELSLDDWCILNGYTYDILTESYITDNIHRLDNDVFDEEITRKLHETRKKN